MYGFITLEISSANDGYLSPTEKFLIGQCDRIFHTNIISYNQWPSHNSSFLAWCSENILETYPNTNTENCQISFRRFIAWPSSVDGFSVFEFCRFFLSLSFAFFSIFAGFDSCCSVAVYYCLFTLSYCSYGSGRLVGCLFRLSIVACRFSLPGRMIVWWFNGVRLLNCCWFMSNAFY